MSLFVNQEAQPNINSVAVWLFFTAFMVFCMAVIGAITRLTESGLSMVEWRPLMGWIPPLSDTEWQRVYGLYQQSPEFEKQHFWMELEDFKRIFFWEWLHRLWGRLLGVIFILPLFWFWFKKQLPASIKPHLVVLLLLGLGQGFMGWYMVMSGLVDRPEVSHYRLAAHLSLALIVYALLIWTGLKTLCPVRTQNGIPFMGYISLFFLSLTIVWGAFVAGLDGGLIYNSWPLMGDRLIPDEVAGLHSLHAVPAAVQFVHRWIALVTLFVLLGFVLRVLSAGHGSNVTLALGGMAFIQVGLGLVTLLSGVVLPLAVLHQAGALMLLGLLTVQLFYIRQAPADKNPDRP